MKGRIAAAAVAASLVAAACGSGSQGATRDERLILAALRRVERQPRTFVYREETEGQTVALQGQVEDDFRYGGAVAINGNDVYTELVGDDAAALRVLRPESAEGLLKAAASIDEIAAVDLRAQKWVVDPAGAPPLRAPGGAGGRASQVGVNPLLDAIRLVAYVQQAVSEAQSVELWNPDGIDYNPLDDPWRDDNRSTLSSKGMRRYDLVQPALPVAGAGGRTALPPAPRHFRKMAFYMRGERLVELREQISFTDRREYRRAKEGRAPKSVLKLIESAQEGFTQFPVRERRLTVTFDYREVAVAIPAEAAPGSLGVALDAAGIGTLFKPPPRATGQADGDVREESPAPSAEASPEPSPAAPAPQASDL
ncbi:MAG: hypothetical protein ACREQY_12845 [Candidatus Binatia bacterium]